MKFLRCASLLAVMLLGVSALAQTPRELHLNGVIDSAGSWTVRGHWSLEIEGRSGKADFSADVSMQRSDYWLVANGQADTATALSEHTHHISLVDADVTPLTNGFELTGTANITVNGSPAPTKVAPSMVTIDVTGGSSINYSNISIKFAMPASSHFGTDPLTGVVRSNKPHESHD